MYCTECGTKIVDGARFCHNCGAPVVWVSLEPAAGPEEEIYVEDAAQAAEEAEDAAVQAAGETADASVPTAEEKAEETAQAAEDTDAEPEETQPQITGRIADQAEALAAKYKEEPAETQAEARQARAEAGQVQAEAIQPKAEQEPAPSDAPESPEMPPQSEENAQVDKSIEEEIKGSQKAEISPDEAPAPAAVPAPAQAAVPAAEGPKTGLSHMLTMILAGASFLFATISINSANWPLRAVVLIACAVLIFLAARKLELPRQIFALPLTLFLAASLADRIITMIKRLMSHNTAGFSIEGISYRLALLIALVLLIFIVYSTSGKKKAPTAVFMILSALFAVYHAYAFVTLIAYGRAVVMYNLGMFAFFAAYVLIAWRYLTGRAAADETEGTQTHLNQVHVENKPEVPAGQPAQPQTYSQSGQPSPAPAAQTDSIYTVPHIQSGSGAAYCSRCGEKLTDDSAFCRKCGYPVR